MVYADTSFWLSLLLSEAHSEQAHAFLKSKDAKLTVSRLVKLELMNGLQLRVYRKELIQPDATLVWSHFLQGEAKGIHIVDADDGAAFSTALELSRKHSQHLGTRSLDLWHVAFAKEKKAAWFLSFDRKQRELARLEGLKLNPMD